MEKEGFFSEYDYCYYILFQQGEKAQDNLIKKSVQFGKSEEKIYLREYTQCESI